MDWEVRKRSAERWLDGSIKRSWVARSRGLASAGLSWTFSASLEKV